MFGTIIFWGALAVGFPSLAFVTYRRRGDVVAKTNAPNVIVSIGGIDTPVGHALADLLTAEMAGFVLAAAAAVASALV